MSIGLNIMGMIKVAGGILVTAGIIIVVVAIVISKNKKQ